MMFHIFLPADAPAWVLDFTRRCVKMLILYLHAEGIEQAKSTELPALEEEDNGQD